MQCVHPWHPRRLVLAVAGHGTPRQSSAVSSKTGLKPSCLSPDVREKVVTVQANVEFHLHLKSATVLFPYTFSSFAEMHAHDIAHLLLGVHSLLIGFISITTPFQLADRKLRHSEAVCLLRWMLPPNSWVLSHQDCDVKLLISSFQGNMTQNTNKWAVLYLTCPLVSPATAWFLLTS